VNEIQDEQLAARLLAEDRRGQETSTRSGDGYTLLQTLVANEQAAEQRVRRLATAAWRAVFALVPLTAALILVMREGDNFVRQIARPGLIVVGIFAILAVSVALLSTAAWLFRSRTASLMVIERRLAALEELLKRPRPQA
jgi:glucan phosphoethanolaminetransferase (alkaline phosphatase superfamily)